MARPCGWEVPVGCLVDAYCGRVPVACVDGCEWVSWMKVPWGMPLIHTQLPLTEVIFVEAQGIPPPPPTKGPTTTVAYVGVCLAQPDPDFGMSSITVEVQPEGCTIVDCPDGSIGHIMAPPVRYAEEIADDWYCTPKMARDAFSLDELDIVCGHMCNPMHVEVPSKALCELPIMKVLNENANLRKSRRNWCNSGECKCTQGCECECESNFFRTFGLTWA